MNLCSDKHDEVCYDGRVCPVCDVRDELQGTIDELEKEIQSLNSEIESLQESD